MVKTWTDLCTTQSIRKVVIVSVCSDLTFIARSYKILYISNWCKWSDLSRLLCFYYYIISVGDAPNVTLRSSSRHFTTHCMQQRAKSPVRDRTWLAATHGAKPAGKYYGRDIDTHATGCWHLRVWRRCQNRDERESEHHWNKSSYSLSQWWTHGPCRETNNNYNNNCSSIESRRYHFVMI